MTNIIDINYPSKQNVNTTPKRKYLKKKPLTPQHNITIFTSTPNKKHTPRKTEEKVDIWEQAMNDDVRHYSIAFD